MGRAELTLIITIVIAILAVTLFVQNDRNNEAEIVKQSCKRTKLIYFTKTNSPAFVYECLGTEGETE